MTSSEPRGVNSAGDLLHPINVRHRGPDRAVGERIADRVTSWVGSWPFIIIQSAFLGVWLAGNAFLIRDWINGKPFDPYPFILLNLMLSFQAAYTAPFVLMSQNRQTARDRDEAEHDYSVDRKALAVLKRLEEDQARLLELLEADSADVFHERRRQRQLHGG